MLLAPLAAALLAVSPTFGPFSVERHPVAGEVDTVPGRGPWQAPPPLQGEVSLGEARAHIARTSGSSNPLYLAFLIYRYFISPADGARCQHYPTCSHYGVLATRRHGPLGLAMTIDRLWQSGQPTAVRPYPVVRVFGHPRFYDPVEASDFWFTGEEQ
jgi:putative component of membrane protein insertase Oxa1/YidC/SpoIIIJ protein YidD